MGALLGRITRMLTRSFACDLTVNSRFDWQGEEKEGMSMPTEKG
jgi:hypothetical protein